MIKEKLTDIYKHKILNIIRDSTALTRTGLQAKTGIRMPTLIKIIQELLARGIITEQSEDNESGMPRMRGRRAKYLSISNDFRYAIIIKFLSETVVISLVGFNGRIIKQERFAITPSCNIRKICIGTCTAFFKSAEKDKLEGVVLSFPGIIDIDTMKICISSVTKSVKSFDFLRSFCARKGLRFIVENPPQALALSELRDSGLQSFCILEIGEGVGCSFIHKGELYRSAGRLEGEIGHVTLPDISAKCGCGNTGCIEAVISKTAIVESTRRLIAGNSDSILYYLAKKNPARIDFDMIVKACNEDDSLAVAHVKKTLTYLHPLLEFIILMLNPDECIITGCITRFNGLLDAALESFVRKYRSCSIPSLGKCKIRVKHYSLDRESTACASLLFDSYYEN